MGGKKSLHNCSVLLQIPWQKNKNGKKDCAFVHSIAFQRLLVHIMTFGSTTQYWGLMFMQMASCEATMQAYKTKENS